MFVIFDPVSNLLLMDEIEGTVELFVSREEADRACKSENEQFHGYIPDPSGDGLIPVKPWKVYQLVEAFT